MLRVGGRESGRQNGADKKSPRRETNQQRQDPNTIPGKKNTPPPSPPSPKKNTKTQKHCCSSSSSSSNRKEREKTLIIVERRRQKTESKKEADARVCLEPGDAEDDCVVRGKWIQSTKCVSQRANYNSQRGAIHPSIQSNPIHPARKRASAKP